MASILVKPICQNSCRPCVTEIIPATPAHANPTLPTPLTAYGRMTNPTGIAVNVGNSPTPLRLAEGSLLQNMVFTEGALQPRIAGTYRITYTLTFGPNDFARHLLTNEDGTTREATNTTSALPETFLDYVNADIIGAILLNGVPLSTSMSYISDVCCESFTLHNSTLTALPVTSIISAGIWAGCPYCGSNQLILIPNSEVSLERVGDIV